jgi:hypothetical protein
MELLQQMPHHCYWENLGDIVRMKFENQSLPERVLYNGGKEFNLLVYPSDYNPYTGHRADNSNIEPMQYSYYPWPLHQVAIRNQFVAEPLDYQPMTPSTCTSGQHPVNDLTSGLKYALPYKPDCNCDRPPPTPCYRGLTIGSTNIIQGEFDAANIDQSARNTNKGSSKPSRSTKASRVRTMTMVQSAKQRHYHCNLEHGKDGQLCSNKFQRPEHLRRHIGTVHNPVRPYVCQVAACAMLFSRKDNLYYHYVSHLSQAVRNSRNIKVEPWQLKSFLGSSEMKRVQHLQTRLQKTKQEKNEILSAQKQRYNNIPPPRAGKPHVPENGVNHNISKTLYK